MSNDALCRDRANLADRIIAWIRHVDESGDGNGDKGPRSDGRGREDYAIQSSILPKLHLYRKSIGKTSGGSWEVTWQENALQGTTGG